MRLIDGVRMRCPRCKKPQHVTDFERLMEIEEFAQETTPVYRCLLCRWVFAPAAPEITDAEVLSA